MFAVNSRNQSNFLSNAAQVFGVRPRTTPFDSRQQQQPSTFQSLLQDKRSVVERKSANPSAATSSSHKSLQKEAESACYRICLKPTLDCRFELFTAAFGYVFNPQDPPQPWAFSTEPGTGYLQIPISAAPYLGFDVKAPKLEQGMLVANWISSTPPLNPDPVNYLPSDVVSALYSFVGLPSVEFPFWLLRPLNYLSNCTKEWQPLDWFFIQNGPYAGIRMIQNVNYTTFMVWVQDVDIPGILKLCDDFCDATVVERCRPQKFYIDWENLYYCADDYESRSSSSRSS